MVCFKSSGVFLLPLWALFTVTIGDQPQDGASRNPAEVALGMNNLATPKTFRVVRGRTSFILLVSRTLFIDKTLFINEILTGENTVTIFTCPSKWGKTTNLVMLKEFVEMEVQVFAMGSVPPKSTQLYKLFTEGKYHMEGINKIELENPMLIMHKKYSHLIDKYLGRYPVIYLEFPFGMALLTDIKRGIKKFAEIVFKAFERHKYMVNVYDMITRDNDALEYEIKRAEKNKKLFESYLSYETEIVNASNVEQLLRESIRFLSQELSRHFDSKVFIFMDDFDQLLASKISPLYEQFLTLTLNDNPCIEKAVLVGVMPITFGANLSINNAVHHNFLSTPLQRFFGITKKEMTLVYRFHKNIMKERKQLEYWYGGYQLYTNLKESMYNLHSVRSFYENHVMFSFWAKVNFLGNLPLKDIFNIPGFSYALSHLLTGNNVNLTYETMDLSKTELDSLKQPDLKGDPSNTVNTALKYMVVIGFLAIKNITFDHKSNLHTSSVGFPNHEIGSHSKFIFAQNLNETFEKEVFELLESTSVVWNNFTMGDNSTSPQLENLLQQCFQKLPSPPTIKNLQYDPIFYSIVLSTIASMGFDFEFINSEFPDILFVHLSRGIVIRIKYEENADKLEIDQYLERVFDECSKLREVTDVNIIECVVRPDKSVEISSTVHSKTSKKRAKKISCPSDST